MSKNLIVAAVVAFSAVAMGGSAGDPNNRASDPNIAVVAKLDARAEQTVWLTQAIRWPALEYKGLAGLIAEPNGKDLADFMKKARAVLDPNVLDISVEDVRFLKGWPERRDTSFVVQAHRGHYVLRVKNQVTHIVASRDWVSYYLVIVVARTDGRTVLETRDMEAVLAFSDQFLSKKVNSLAQRYGAMENMDGSLMTRPYFEDSGHWSMIGYPVEASHPDIDSVCIWTNGKVVVIGLQERRKVVLRDEAP